MRLMIIRHLYILVLFFLASHQAMAMAFDMQAERVWWRYQEDKKDQVYPQLPGRANGHGALLKLRLGSERDQDWIFSISAARMQSLSATSETWQNQQVNDLNITQQDIRLDAQYRVLGAHMGVWLANRKQRQRREHFVIAGTAVTVAGEPIDEVVRSTWAGLSLTSVGGSARQFETRIDAALALRMEVTNPLFAAPFTKKDGYRTGVHFRWRLPKSETGVQGMHITLRYEYQDIGGEKTSAGFWPNNRWQMASLGLLYAW